MLGLIIKRPVLVAMVLIGLCLLGAVSYTRLSVELIPFTELPMLVVQVGTTRDADPILVEQQAVIPLESAVAGLEDIERIESYINRRRATILVYYEEDADLKYAYLKLQERVAATEPDLGSGFFAAVWKIDTEQLSNQFMTIQARGEGSLDQIRAVVDRKITQELQSVDGIANIEVYGGREHSIEIQLHEDALAAHGITASQVMSAIAAGGGERQYLGKVSDGRQELFVNLINEYRELPSLEDVIVRADGPVLLKHVGTVVEGGADKESISRVNGQEAVALSLLRDQQINLLKLSSETRKTIDELNTALRSDGVTLVIQYDSAESIRKNIDTIKKLALIGGLLAVVILWIFLRHLPLVLIVAATIPITVLISMNVLYALDISINTLTLVGIAIAIGMLVDNSIVVLENTYRRLSTGAPVREAVVTGAGEVWRAVMAATLTTTCVFVPFIYSDNFLVQTLGKHVGVAIVSTLLISLGVAFLLIPSFTYYYLRRRRAENTPTFNLVSQRNRLLQIYTLLLKSCLRFPARTVVLGLVVFFLSVVLCLAVSVNVSEEVELESFSLYATPPSGTTLESADDQVLEMDSRLVDIVELEERVANIQEDNIIFTFRLKEDYADLDSRDIPEIKADILERLEESHPLIDLSYEEPVSNTRFRGGSGMGGGFGENAFARLLGIGSGWERIIVRGSNLELLRAIADDIQYNLENLDVVSNTHVSVTQRQPGLDILLDHGALTHFDVSARSVMDELAAFQENTRVSATFKRGAEDIGIILKSDEDENKTSDDLRDINVPSNTGSMVPLVQLGRLIYSDGYSNINRVNQEKQVEVSLQFQSDVGESNDLLTSARLAVEQVAQSIEPPPGVAIEVEHDETDYSEFYFLIGAAVLLIYMILASVFESLLTPLAMMFTLPLATIGSFWGLIVTGNSLFNANALIGFMILLGVVVNNGIILIDYSRNLRRNGFRTSRALLCAGQGRVRPILITAITTALAMLPLAMGKAEYVGRIGAPFAIAVIGGLVAGTLFTLLIVPTVSFGLENTVRWLRNLDWKTKFFQLAAFTGMATIVWYNIDSTLWRVADIVMLILLIPAVTYFVKTSLRRSRVHLIAPDQPIQIRIRNLIKMYDNHSRFAREWRKPERQRPLEQRDREGTVAGRLTNLAWQLPLYGYLFYFNYLYLEGGFWILVFSVVFYLYTLKLLDMVLMSGQTASRWKRRIISVVFWLGPAACLVWLWMQWDSISLAVIVGLLWYVAILIRWSSRRLYDGNIDVARLTGRFRRTRSAWYRFVKMIPVIGKRRRPFKALDQVSLDIGSGMFGLVGPNGAGKTTLMRIICGILTQTTGKVSINDIDVDEKREELQSLIGYLPQEFGTYRNMTAYQFLDYQALLKGLWNSAERRKTVEKAIASVHLDDSRDVKIKNFSGGMRQRIGIAQTLLRLPRILVVDEPTAGLDPRERIRFRNRLSELAQNRIVIFSTHVIEDVSSSCNRLAVLNKGKVIFLGSPTEMAGLAAGKVWLIMVKPEDLDDVRTNMKVVHHSPDGDRVKVRVLADKAPLPDAQQVLPTLEDSYLWLLGREAEE